MYIFLKNTLRVSSKIQAYNHMKTGKSCRNQATWISLKQSWELNPDARSLCLTLPFSCLCNWTEQYWNCTFFFFAFKNTSKVVKSSTPELENKHQSPISSFSFSTAWDYTIQESFTRQNTGFSLFIQERSPHMTCTRHTSQRELCDEIINGLVYS